MKSLDCVFSVSRSLALIAALNALHQSSPSKSVRGKLSNAQETKKADIPVDQKQPIVPSFPPPAKNEQKRSVPEVPPSQMSVFEEALVVRHQLKDPILLSSLDHLEPLVRLVEVRLAQLAERVTQLERDNENRWSHHLSPSTPDISIAPSSDERLFDSPQDYVAVSKFSTNAAYSASRTLHDHPGKLDH